MRCQSNGGYVSTCAPCSVIRISHSAAECIFLRPAFAPSTAANAFTHFQFLIKLLLLSTLPGSRLIHIHTIYKFITFHKYTTTSDCELACGATIAELSIARCTISRIRWAAWRLCTVHSLLICSLVHWFSLGARETAAVRMQLLSSFLEISYSSLEIDYFIGKNGIWQSGAPREMIMFVVWYFIWRRHTRTNRLENGIYRIPFRQQHFLCASVWTPYRTHSHVQTRSNWES